MINSSMSGVSQVQHSHRHHGGGKAGQDFKALGDALKSGDLGTAQKAFQGLQANAPNSGGAATAKSPVGADINALGQALQSGDIAAAQKAFAAIQQDARAQKPQRGGSPQPAQQIPDANAGDSDAGISVNISA